MNSPEPVGLSPEPQYDQTSAEYDGGRHTEVADSESPRQQHSEWESSSAQTTESAAATAPAPTTERIDGDASDTPRAEDRSHSDTTLFEDDEMAGWRARWDHVQAGFVDDPKDCVQKADSLVSDVVSQLTSGFTDARARLEQQWGRGQEASTEDLRLALKRYREFFERLLAV